MGLKEEYQEAKELVLSKLDIDQPSTKELSHFEFVIRIVGGLLSAHELDPDPRYLEKAIVIADRLLVAFNSPSGLPPGKFHVPSGRGVGESASMASVSTRNAVSQ